MPDIVGVVAVSVISDSNRCFLYSKPQGYSSTLSISASLDSHTFDMQTYLAQIINEPGGKLDASKISFLNISKSGNDFLATYRIGKKSPLHIARTSNLLYFKSQTETSIYENGIILRDYKHNGHYLMYFGQEEIKTAISSDLFNWEIGKTVVSPEKNFYGEFPVEIAGAFLKNYGILVFYLTKQKQSKFETLTLNAVVLDHKDPTKVIGKFENPIWETHKDWLGQKVKFVSLVEFKEKIISYWNVGTNLFAINHGSLHFNDVKTDEKGPEKAKSPLRRSDKNPIIKPKPENLWESRATFNPTAFVDDNKVHIVYRAIGTEDVSVLGYATSFDGIHIDSRHNEPIYTPREPFECSASHSVHASYSPFVSGGGCYGGCEDPRITKIGDKLYMTYVAYDGQNPPRVALTSIDRQDFKNHNWNWEKPVLISAPTEVNKNACILPEKAKGKYVIFHRVYPNILIDYVDDLEFDGETWLEGHFKIPPRHAFWDSRKVGAGATPIRTEKGWLLIYHAVGDNDSSKYKIGAMLLDLDDPAKVLHRSDEPILEPNEWYENEGHKFGVAYPCGAVSLNNQLIIYYGGADTVVCAATANMDDFLYHLTTSEKAKVTPVQFQSNYA